MSNFKADTLIVLTKLDVNINLKTLYKNSIQTWIAFWKMFLDPIDFPQGWNDMKMSKWLPVSIKKEEKKHFRLLLIVVNSFCICTSLEILKKQMKKSEREK